MILHDTIKNIVGNFKRVFLPKGEGFWAAHFAQGQKDKFEIFRAINTNGYDHRSFLALLR